MIADSTAPQMNAAMTIPATAPAPYEYNSRMVRYSDRVIYKITFLHNYLRIKNAITVIQNTFGCLGGAAVESRTRDRKVAGSTPGLGAIKSTKSTQPSISPG